MATIHELSQLILGKDYIASVLVELEKLGANSIMVGANSIKVGANSKYKFYSGGELVMWRNRYHSLNTNEPREMVMPTITSLYIIKVTSGITPSLTTLYNSYIELGKWPCAWKMGEWTPEFKKGDRQQAMNDCPITSLVTVNKTFEHMLSKQVTGHYDPTLYQRLTAYRRHRSCQTILLRLVEAVDRKELVYIMTIDMSKAFDPLCHSLIVKKLEAYGFGQTSLNLRRSYFDNRLNRVKIGLVFRPSPVEFVPK